MRRPEIPGFSQLVEIGEGASATVYRADQPAHGRQVAIKVLNATMVAEADRLAFERELTAMGRLADHPHIVDLLQSGFSDDGRPYIVMPWYRRGNYAARVDRDGPLAWIEVLDFGVKVASALHTAHTRQIVHRDVKPANVFMGTFAGHPILADFGISSFVRPSLDGQPTVTISTTPLFAAPEVLNGERPSAASDLYSFGATLFSLLTGRAAYSGPSMEVLVAAITSDRPPPRPDSGAPPALDDLVVAMLAKEPDDRPPSLLDIAHRLAGLQRALGLDPTPVVVDDGGPDTAWAGAATGADESWATHTTAPPADLPAAGRWATETTVPPAGPASAPVPAGTTAPPVAPVAPVQPPAVPVAPVQPPVAPVAPVQPPVAPVRPPAVPVPPTEVAGDRSLSLNRGLDLDRELDPDRDPDLDPGAEPGLSAAAPEGRADGEGAGGPGAVPAGLETVEVRPEHRVPDPRRERPPEPQPPAAPARRRWPRAVAALVAVAGLVLGVGYLSSLRSDRADPPAAATGAWTSTPALVASAPAHEGPVRAVAFAPDGAWLATGGQDGVLRLAPAGDPGTAVAIATGEGWVLGLAWSPDGTALATASSTGSVTVRPVADPAGPGSAPEPAPAPTTVIAAHPGSTAEAVAWSPDGGTLASAGGDGQVRLWRPDGTPIRNLATGSAGGDQQARPPQLAVGWSPDGSRVAAGGKDGVLRVWDAASGQLLASLALPDWVRSIDWSPDGRNLATSSPDGVSRVVSPDGGQVTAERAVGVDLTGPTRWSPDGRRLAAGTVTGQMVVWDPATGDELARAGTAGGEEGTDRAVLAVAWAPAGDRVVVGRQDGSVDIWAGEGD
ncbi:MAG: serine/threonine-protein kinase [Acidimicrobiales bacterium]